MVSSVKPGDVCLDIGANYGYYTLMLSKLCGPGGTVHAFEPVKGTYATLLEVMAANQIANVMPHNCALSNRTGTGRMIFNHQGDLSACLSDVGFYVPEITDSIPAKMDQPVDTTTLDAFSNSLVLDRMDFVKIDAQGADRVILEHGAETIARFKPIIICEAIGAQNIIQTSSLLASMGYRVTCCQENISPLSAYTVHILATPISKPS